MVHTIKFTDDVLKVQIGVKFIIEIDNGDSCEWWRLQRIESPIYATKTMASEAFEMFLQSIAREERHRVEKYIKETRNITKEGIEDLHTRCEKHILNKCDIAKAHLKYEDVFIYTKPTKEIHQYNISD